MEKRRNVKASKRKAKLSLKPLKYKEAVVALLGVKLPKKKKGK